MNFAAEILRAAAPAATALIALDGEGRRQDVTFAEVDDRSARLATRLTALGARKGSVVMTVMGNSPDWVATVMGSLRVGAVALPCVTQSRPGDLALRARLVQPAAVVASGEHVAVVKAAGLDCAVLALPDDGIAREDPAGFAEVGADDPALLIFTSGTSGDPKAVIHGVRYLFGQALQAEHWFDVRAGDVSWCTAAAGWSKAARNSFIAPWLAGATPVLHDARFDPQQRVDLLAELGVNALCMSPTEYRMVLRRARVPQLLALRSAVAAGEALEASTVEAWHEVSGTSLRDGYGQTETGAVTANPPGEVPRPGSMGRALPGVALSIEGGQLFLDPASSPTFFLGYHDRPAPSGPWATGDLVDRDEDGYLWFRGRADDIIVSAGYRIGPVEVEAALAAHPAVAEAAVVGAADAERGQVVRAIVVLADDAAASDGLVGELQEHVKQRTAPYKYPRIVEFAEALPRTPSGKLRRAQLR